MRRLALFAFVYYLAGPALLAAAGGPQLSPAADAHLRSLVEEGFHTGIVVGLVDPSGEAYFSYGLTARGSDRPVDPDTLFGIGSITKVFTAVLLAERVERGLASFEDPISKYLPDGLRAPTRGREIQLTDLATHTSGLTRLPDNNERAADFLNPYSGYTEKQMFAFLSSYELQHEVGEHYEYSSFGSGLLGDLLARQAGCSYEELVRRTILEELEMKSSAITLSAELRARLAQGYNVMSSPVPIWDFPVLAGSGALRSTARDMIAFIAANLGLRESRLLEAMRTTHQGRFPSPPEKPWIGLGWFLNSDAERPVVWHNGATLGFRSFAGFDAARRVGVVVLTNTQRSIDDLGFHLLDPSRELPEIPKRRKIPLFSKSEDG